MHSSIIPTAVKKSRHAKLHLILMSIISFSIGFFMSYDAAIMREAETKILDDYSARDVIPEPSSVDSSTLENSVPLTTLELLGRVATQEKRIMTKLAEEYGGYSSDIFNALNLERLFHISESSRKRLMRRLMIKILQGRESKIDTVMDNPPTFHWVTSGDSSAGYGNKFSDSYTSILEDTVFDIFQAVGVNFKATNRAGDEWSGMELGICMESIFGKNVDVLSWDFRSIGDEDVLEPLQSSGQYLDPSLFAERLGKVYPGLPFFVALRHISSLESLENMNKLESRGLGFGALNEDYLREIILNLPDSNLNSELDPPAIRMFRCGKKIEGSEWCNNQQCDVTEATECLQQKFQQFPQCPMSNIHQTNNNDGWKMHRIKGRLLGFLLMDTLRQAVIALDILEQQEPHPLELLEKENEIESFLFLKTQASENKLAPSILQSWNDVKLQSALCTISNIDQSHLSNSLEPSEESLCSELLPFPQSYFTLNEDTEVLRINLAGPKENAHEVGSQVDSLVGFCPKKCYFNQCPAEEYDIDLNDITIQVNGMSVSGIESFGGCYFLKSGEGGLSWRLHNADELSTELSITRQGGSPISLTSVFQIIYAS